MKNKTQKGRERNVTLGDRNGSVTAGLDSAFVGSRCEVCKLPGHERERIEAELAAGQRPLSAIAASIGASKTAVWRHAKNHLIARTRNELKTAAAAALSPAEAEEFSDMDRELETLADLRELRVREQLVPLYKQAREFMKTAKDGNNWQAVKWFMAEARQLLELAGRVNGEFLDHYNQSGTTVQVLVVMPRANELPQAGHDTAIEATATTIE